MLNFGQLCDFLAHCYTVSFLLAYKRDVASLTAIIRHSGVASESCTGLAPRGVLLGELDFPVFKFIQVPSHKSRHSK